MAADGADVHENLAHEQDDYDDEDEDEVSKKHEFLFDEVRKGCLGWIHHSTNLALNISAEESSQKYAEKKSEFKKKYERCFRGGRQDDTIIHSLVKEKDKDMQKFKPLLQLVLEIDPTLLNVANDEDETPIYSAIRARNSELVDVSSPHSELIAMATWA
jgi:hypothetical protein